MTTSDRRIAAIFDMDYTLITGSSAKMLMDYLRRQGKLYNYISWRDLPHIFGTVLLYRLGLADPTHLFARIGNALAGHTASDLWEISRHWFTDTVVDAIYDGGMDKLQWHRRHGHIPIICSGSSQFAVNLLAEHLNITDWIATEWIVENGTITGDLRRPLTYGIGKVFWMEQWAARNDVDLAASYFYTDHISDLPLLERVAHPIAVNPDRRLARLAQRKAWQILTW